MVIVEARNGEEMQLIPMASFFKIQITDYGNFKWNPKQIICRIWNHCRRTTIYIILIAHPVMEKIKKEMALKFQASCKPTSI